MKHIHILFWFISIGIFSACAEDKTENNLETGERTFIEELGILDPGEEMEMFECNSGFDDVTKSGNFITNRRIASYWIEDGKKEIHSALFGNEIDSLSQTDNHTKLTYASFVTVYKTDGSSFNVYIDKDSTRVHDFFNKAQTNWESKRKNN
ncbi:hypothetical protein [Fluviicola chungangensis]|uniref:Lipoprotein n=1 Tax=Fluviicola chungangensis TaxID=2597671 RepID=A0A556N6Y7_9FLAO|nr:hypothetical protein [Fluviicola chungangensis]TSJ47952.1 hypothetical protein FO442_02125 [Fluviicola chungangensis]